ncbi:MAG: mismatch-specific DNA-glycosylase [Alphaproteobacteria bacterium]
MTALPKSGLLPDTHRVPDVLAPDLKVVFCGTALGHRSALAKAYYANPGNLFWRALHETGLTPRRFAPQEYAGVLKLGIGLTDLCKHAFGNDADLPADAFDIAALREKIARTRPRILAFTSKTGAASFLGKATGDIAYGFQPERIGRTRIYVLSSPSGHGRKYWRQDVWQALADEVNS